MIFLATKSFLTLYLKGFWPDNNLSLFYIKVTAFLDVLKFESREGTKSQNLNFVKIFLKSTKEQLCLKNKYVFLKLTVSDYKPFYLIKLAHQFMKFGKQLEKDKKLF